MYILATRPWDDSENLAGILTEYGIEVFIEPMLKIQPLDLSLALLNYPFNDVQIIVFTSINAIRGFAKSAFASPIITDDLATKKIIVIGDKSREIAKQYGFINIEVAGFNAQDLLVYIKTNYSSNDGGNILYCCGDNLTIDLAGELQSSGYNINSLICYRSIAVKSLSSELERIIIDNKLAAATFFSVRSAEIFVNNVIVSNRQLNFKNTTAFALSDKIEAALSPILWNNVVVTNIPSQEELIDLVVSHYEK